MLGRKVGSSRKSHQGVHPTDHGFLQGEDESLKIVFGKDADQMTPQEIIMCKMYTELMYLKNYTAKHDPLDNIRIDLAMRKKFDTMHAIFQEQKMKSLNDGLFKPYFIEIIPVSVKQHGDTSSINAQEESDEDNIIIVKEEDTVIVEDNTQNQNYFNFYPIYDFDGDGTLDRHDFNCEYKINNKLVELTYTEIEESLEKMNNSTQNRIYEIFHNENYVDKSFGRISAVWYCFIMLTVAASLIGACCASVKSWEEEYKYEGHENIFNEQWNMWEILEMISTIILTLEYVITIFMVRNRCIYVLSFQNVIDILACAPWYIWIIMWAITKQKWEIVESIGNLVRVLRVLRIFKCRALSNPYVLLVLSAVREFILGTGFAVGIIVAMSCLFLGSLMFAAQNHDLESGYGNIFMGMWFVLVTMSTVGYGDISPTTPIGYVCGLLTIVVGVTVFSMVLMVTSQYYSDLLNDYNDEIRDIEEVLLSLVKENADEYRKILREESGETLYMKVEYALRCKKEN